LKVTVDKSSGFCWGVIRTIEIAEKELAQDEKLYSLGDIIHNPVEIERLKSKGLKTISHSDLDHVKDGTVLIRAHGEPPETYKKMAENGIKLIDATCPVVAKVQERIRRFYEDGYQVIIFGKKEHAEVIGLVGQTEGKAIVIKSLEEIEKIDLDKKTVLFSQTTMDKSTFYTIKEELSRKIKELVTGSIEEEALKFYAKDTICGQVFNREKKIKEFAAANELVIFVAGKHSSNGKVLYEIVKSVNPGTKFIENYGEIEPEWFVNVETVGITGATSTPQWLMEDIKKKIEEMEINKDNNSIEQSSKTHELINH
jgi:4-hydroxy-3-methylbut-2-enyl diphosphate reductase